VAASTAVAVVDSTAVGEASTAVVVADSTVEAATVAVTGKESA
jgi:hypothetical protein